MGQGQTKRAGPRTDPIGLGLQNLKVSKARVCRNCPLPEFMEVTIPQTLNMCQYLY